MQDTHLARLLIRACPPDDSGGQTIAGLARALGMSRWGVYKWIRHDRIRPMRAKQIVGIADGRVTLADFEPYIYKN